MNSFSVPVSNTFGLPLSMCVISQASPFQVIEHHKLKRQGALWNIFDEQDTLNFDSLPSDSSLTTKLVVNIHPNNQFSPVLKVSDEQLLSIGKKLFFYGKYTEARDQLLNIKNKNPWVLRTLQFIHHEKTKYWPKFSKRSIQETLDNNFRLTLGQQASEKEKFLFV